MRYLILILICFWGCRETGLPKLTLTDTEIVDGFNEFGFNLFKEINKIEGDTNIVISSLSASMALGMLLNGARDSTEKAMKNVLGFDGLTDDEINHTYRKIKDLLPQLDNSVKLNIANSIWYREDLKVRDKFKSTCEKYFDAKITALNFSDPNAKDVINNWIETETNGKIEDVVDYIDPEDVMVLVNALYYKGIWTFRFPEESTFIDTFYSPTGKIPCYMMRQKIYCKYLDEDKFDAIILPYGNKNFNMMVILPESNIDTVINDMNSENWERWLNDFTECTVHIYFPKFKIKCKYDNTMKEALTSLGMGIAFTPGKANFKDIFEDVLCDSPWIRKAIHATFIQVDEEGTEAAAATVIILYEGYLQPLYFYVKRPFIFVIFDNYTGTILFIGKVMYPVWKED